MRYLVATCVLFLSTGLAYGAGKPKRAKNVILLLADAGGVPTVSAASLFGYNAPQKLYVQSWPHLGLSDTTPVGRWVTDSAAGMTALVTGTKTRNGFISQGPDGIRGKKDGTPLKTILEYAEEHGLSTGVLSNVAIADATPAACYAHNNDRSNLGAIFNELFSPRFGDGVDVLFGPGRTRIWESAAKAGIDLDAAAKKSNRTVYSSMAEVGENARRALVVVDGAFDLADASKKAVRMLSKNSKGFFLMIESDAHTNDIEAGLTRLVNFDKLIREIDGMVKPAETLFIFVADHSFDFRVVGGSPDEPLLKGLAEFRAANPKGPIRTSILRMENSHTGEEVAVTAKGPGAENIHGFLPNTQIFQVMLTAYGWAPKATKR
ncbi:MAG: alkaline phosphatase [Bryobacterales bacterium]|nr:alkaline phosphatase [Bryobacterales bacterium]